MYQVNILLKLHFFYAKVQNKMQTSIDISLMQKIVARFRLNTQKVINLFPSFGEPFYEGFNLGTIRFRVLTIVRYDE